MRDLASIRGFGPARLRALEDKGIRTSADLMERLPVGYRDTTQPLSPAQMLPGTRACFEGYIVGTPALHRVRGRQWVSATVADECGSVRCMWFNQPWMKDRLHADQHVVLYGTCTQKKNGRFVINPSEEEPGKIIPVYGQIPGVGQKVLRDAVGLLLSEYDEPDPLPAGLPERYGLMERGAALKEAHFPGSISALERAKRRLAFEELLLFQAAVAGGAGRRGAAHPARIPDEAEAAFWKGLPYRPTNAQRRVAAEIRSDMAKTSAMARLVQGDVGSGKTLIAFYALWLAVQSGGQGALMAPTEILAQQHWQSAGELLGRLGVTCGLLTGSMTAAERRRAREAIACGEWQVIIGTHALISEDVEYRDLRLVVTDEQHRFGVRQRTRLQAKGAFAHVLVMSATPIPRTLSLILYGDLDLSVVDEMPPGRRTVNTRIVPEEKRDGLYDFIRQQADKGRQTYVVCPTVGEEDMEDDGDPVPSATARQKEMQKRLPSLRIGLVHGRMNKQEKEDTVLAFRQGQTDVLVATTVIEVGVNVPNATVMVIESADRFGLAQLHQLRGRVGRGAEESWCFLMAEPNERLRILQETSDGFKIAEKDLELRGAGEVFGTRQHGAPEMPALMLTTDTSLLEETHRAFAELSSDASRRGEYEALCRAAQRRHGNRMENAGIN
ncbi:MAG: ATP-dependent DNA helicase RecG [Clostridia bacterium]|nr:ATP-dependent DNA helicase RecG [Clostridia bacterium]